ncbi:TPA: type II secretion system protein [Candidatus Saccharibacteria bacterium]|nr:type II secretion system protein [Candidatus Saccharibacteria bacterium]HIO87981.1 type II secretion system protein [Candidatus Saccharibacteria bacterium]
MKVSSLRKQQGFTIIELLIVIVVIGILAGLVLNAFGNIQERARDTERQNDINALHTALELYYADNGYYPAALSDLNVNAESLEGPNAETYNFATTASCTTLAGNCAEYTLNATMETDQDDDGDVDASDVFARDSLNGNPGSL